MSIQNVDYNVAALKEELNKLNQIEKSIDNELLGYLHQIGSHELHPGIQTNQTKNINQRSHNLNNSPHSPFKTSNIQSYVQKIDNFAPHFEAMFRDTKKIQLQLEEGDGLSERLSRLVRRLDMIQIRAQQALACTEDIINLKECKLKISSAIENKQLSEAVSYLRMVHDIDHKAAGMSEDFDIILQKEKIIKEMVQNEFHLAISESNIKSVMSLCPLLQTLGLEAEARDSFLQFVEKSIFTVVSADASSVEGATDPATGYAQALSNIFNSAFLIIQQYLPMVIQGMENSHGDIHFIRRLHKKCEYESGLVLKRYMKYRNIKDVIHSIKPAPSGGLGVSVGTTSKMGVPSSAEIHALMDEMALMIQYCCRYAKYLKQVCTGAESKPRGTSKVLGIIHPPDDSHNKITNGSTSSIHPPMINETILVFQGPTDFDKMVDELINKYYMEGEQWLMRNGVRMALPKSIVEGINLDECFFVLQKCGLRSVASSNIHASCALLHHAADLLSSELLQQATDMLSFSCIQIGSILQETIHKYKASLMVNTAPIEPNSSHLGREGGSDIVKSAAIAKGFATALSLASSTIANATTSIQAVPGDPHTENKLAVSLSHLLGNDHEEDDPWDVGKYIEAFNVVEMCVRYTDRLAKEIYSAGANVFADEATATSMDTRNGSNLNKGNANGPVVDHHHGSSPRSSSLPPTAGTLTSKPMSKVSSELDKLKLCKEDFDSVKMSFSNLLKKGAEKLLVPVNALMKDLLSSIFGKMGPFGGIKFDEPEATFDKQLSLNLIPKVITLPMEAIVRICTHGLSDNNKNMLVGLLADLCCERVEHFISQTLFRFPGALKLEEIVRALSAVYTKHSSVPIRGKFARLKEILIVLSADPAMIPLNSNGSTRGGGSGSSSSLIMDSITQLTNHEVDSFLSLRLDIKQ